MTDATKAILAIVILAFLFGWLCGFWSRPTPKYGYGRNPYRRFCGECGQQQVFDVNTDDSGTHQWLPCGTMLRPGCVCNDKVPSEYFPNKNPNTPEV